MVIRLKFRWKVERISQSSHLTQHTPIFLACLGDIGRNGTCIRALMLRRTVFWVNTVLVSGGVGRSPSPMVVIYLLYV